MRVEKKFIMPTKHKRKKIISKKDVMTRKQFMEKEKEKIEREREKRRKYKKPPWKKYFLSCG